MHLCPHARIKVSFLRSTVINRQRPEARRASHGLVRRRVRLLHFRELDYFLFIRFYLAVVLLPRVCRECLSLENMINNIN